MKKYSWYLAVSVLFCTMTALGIWAETDNTIKLSDSFHSRIRDVQYDQQKLQNEMTQIYLQWAQSPQGKRYAADQETIQHDQGEIDSIKKEALAAAKLDPQQWDVDVEKAEFVTKPKPTAPTEKK